MYVLRNIEARSCNNCSRGKTIIIINSECVCVCSLGYPACNSHAPYCHLWPLQLYIFPHYSTFCPHSVCVDLRTNSDYFPIQH